MSTTQFITEKIPSYWSLSKTRCLIYSCISAASTYVSGLQGYKSYHDMSTFQIQELIIGMFISAGMAWIAFLDNTLGNIKQPKLTSKDFLPINTNETSETK